MAVTAVWPHAGNVFNVLYALPVERRPASMRTHGPLTQ
jgi:hypothetical protein